MRILLFGGGGQIGSALKHRLSLDSRHNVTSPNRAQLDIASPSALREVIRSVQPDIVINAAAYTAVDRAETEAARAAQINTVAPQVMAEECGRLAALFVHYSTDYVFDGEKSAPYDEGDSLKPINVYGRTKADADLVIAGSRARFLILRVSWIYSHLGKNFLLTILRLAREQNVLRIVDDQRGAPTTAALVADVTLDAVFRAAPLEGIYHLAPAGTTTWCGFARSILALRGRRDVRIEPIRSSEYPTPARRPKNSVLCTDKLQRALSLPMPSWEACLERLIRTKPFVGTSA